MTNSNPGQWEALFYFFVDGTYDPVQPDVQDAVARYRSVGGSTGEIVDLQAR